jgi:hypothetical protein
LDFSSIPEGYFVSQLMTEVKRYIRKEKAIKATIPSRLTSGMSIQVLVIASRPKPTILNPGTTRVTIYRAMAEDAHLKNPKVTRFMGRRRIFMMGLTRSVEPKRPNPARKSVVRPFSKTIPEAIWEAKYRETVSNT